jgi:hypothetical protein
MLSCILNTSHVTTNLICIETLEVHGIIIPTDRQTNCVQVQVGFKPKQYGSWPLILTTILYCL